jgi:hypothetical protein
MLGQNSHYHPLIHTVVLAGGLNKQNNWFNTVKNSLLMLKYCSNSSVGKSLYYLKQYYEQNRLEYYNNAKKYEYPKTVSEMNR